MNVVFLALACILFSAQFIFSKMYQKNTDASMMSGMWFSAVTAFMSVAALVPSSGFQIKITASSVILSVIYTAASIIVSCALIIAMNHGSLAVVTTAELVGGMILPFFYGIFILGEQISAAKIIGVAVILASPLCSLVFAEKTHGDKTKGSNGKLIFAFMCAAVFIGNGLISVSSKAQSISANAVSSEDFLILSGIMRLAVSLGVIIFIAYRAGGGKFEKRLLCCFNIPEKKANAIFGAVTLSCVMYTIFNTLGNVFSLECAKTMDSSIQFPILSAAVIVITALLARIIYKEHVKRADLIGLGLSVAGIIIFMLN